MFCEFATKVYKGYGNPLTFIPYSDIKEKAFLNMSGVTKVELWVGCESTDSVQQPDAVKWEQVGTHWEITVKPGLVADIVEGEADLRVIVYDSVYPNGLVVLDDYSVLVTGDC